MQIVCLDLEGVLVPEIWIALAERSGIEELRLTTRDIPDYDELIRVCFNFTAPAKFAQEAYVVGLGAPIAPYPLSPGTCSQNGGSLFSMFGIF